MHTLEQLRSGALQGVQRLQLRGGLTEFPREIFDLADTLEILDLTDNALSALPEDLPRLHKLRILFCSNNRFTELPAMLGQMPALTMVGFKANQIHTVPASALPPQLRWLVLTDNCIEEIPAELGRRPALQKLMLAGNRLSSLPVEMAQLSNLELLRISANNFTELPAWLPTLPRLAWLACAGNPWGAAREAAMAAAPAPTIDWQQLQIEQQLGEGASGVIHRAIYRHDGVAEAVAVKLYKGAMTSDGSPLNEMSACLNVGAHPNLVPVLGRLTGHPDGTHGLVMPLIDPAFINLAGPPSFASCTRDVYDDNQRFAWSHVLSIAHGAAAAAAQLHARGMLHGDLYAHNIVHNAAGHSLLGDFGAAAFYDPTDHMAIALQRLEVRAFGLLLEELFSRTDESVSSAEKTATNTTKRELLRKLQVACNSEDIAARPVFEDIARQLQKIKQD